MTQNRFKTETQAVVFLCIWVLFLFLFGALLFEREGIAGAWFQVFGAGVLILVGLFDLLSVTKSTERIKGISISLCSLILLIPALKTAIG